MADNTENKILVSVEILDNFIAAKKNLEQWKKALADAEKSGTATNEELAEITRNLTAANQQFQSSRRTLENSTRAQEILNAANEQTNRSLGDLRRELTALRNAPLDNLGADEVREVQQRIADLTAEIQDYQNEIRGLDTGEIFANTAEGLQAIIAGVSTLSGTLSILGVESDVFGKLQKSTTELIAVVQALGVVTEYLEKKKYSLIAANLRNITVNSLEVISKKLNTLQTYALANAETMSTAAKIKSAIAIKLLTAAQWLWNAALAANPIMLIIVAVAALATGIAFLTLRTTESEKATRAAESANKSYERQIAKTQNTIDVINNKRDAEVEKLKLKGRQEIEDLTRNKAKREDIAKRQYEIASEIRRVETKSSNDVIAAKSKELIATKLNIEAQEKKLKTLKKGSDEYIEQIKLIEGLVSAYNKLDGAISSEYFKVQNLAQDQIEEDRRIKEEGIRLAKERADKAYDNLLTSLENQKKFNEQSIKAEADYQSDDFSQRQYYTQRLFDLNQSSEKKRLDLQLKYGKISKEEYKKQNEILEAAFSEFSNSQIKSFNEYYSTQRKELMGLINQDIDTQIKDIEEKYSKALDDLGKMQAPIFIEGQTSTDDYEKELKEYKDFMFNRAKFEKEIETQKAKEIEEIKKASLTKQISDIDKKINEQYQGDLAKYSDNERKKTEIEIKELEDRIAEKKAKNLDYYEDEASLRNTQNQLNIINQDTQLLKAGENARSKYEIRKAFLEKEQEIYKDNADRQAQIAHELAENEKEYMEARIAMMEKYGSAVGGILSGISDLSSSIESSQLQQYEENNAKKKEDLDNRLKMGLISQSEYDKQVEEADAEFEKKKVQAARRQAIREKAAKVFEIGINTASGIMKAISASPLTFGLPWSAFVAATGALQLASVIAQPLPKASKGMYIKGNSHSNGGVQIEAEGGEVIMTKRAVNMYGPLLSAMNVAGGGIPFSTPMSDGGFTSRASRSSKNINSEDLATLVKNAVKDVRIYTTVEDYRRADLQYTTISGRKMY